MSGQVGMTYAGVGVRYDDMDPFKRAAQVIGRRTAGNIARLADGEFIEFEASRGESCYLIEAAKSYLALVEEGLGTKNLVADAMYKLTGRSYYDYIAQDTVAMIVNDMITVGALPLSVAMHLAVGSSDWFDDSERSGELLRGWGWACDKAGCTWGGGETPTLRDIVIPGTVVLSGSAMGLVKPKGRLIMPDRIEENDAIMLFESSGIHANGLTLARRIADKLPDGYLTKLSDGRTYGEALLDPTHIYVKMVEACFNAGIDIRYAVNITGHGWRKLMRAPQPFAYIIDYLPKPLPIFDFLQEHGPVSDEEAYGNLNMGAGFALIIPSGQVTMLIKLVDALNGPDRFKTWHAGYVEASKDKKVVIRPKSIEFAGDNLAVR